MNTVKWLGILSFLLGLLLLGFHAIGILMEKAGGVYSESLAGLLGEGSTKWIEGLPFEALRGGADFIMQSPLYVVLLGAGVLLLIIQGLFAKS